MVGSSQEEGRRLLLVHRAGHFPVTKGPGHHKRNTSDLGMSLSVVKRGVRGLEGVMADGTSTLTSCFT